jgi:pilus assembly protein CpaB
MAEDGWMSRARLLILLLAIGSGLVAVMLVRGMMGQQPAAPVVAEAPRTESVPVLVAAKDITMGERLTGLAVEWRDWPRDNVAGFMITREARPDAIREIEGGRARAPIIQGEPIADRKILAVEEGNLMSSLVREGLRAYAVRVSDRTAGSGFILPNDRVDVIATFKVQVEAREGEEAKEIGFSSTIITNARVLAINQSLAAGADTASLPDVETAVLELDLQQAEVVARSESQGELSLALRSLGDAGNGGSSDDRPALASLTEAPNSVELFRQGIRSIYSCEPRCDPVLQMGNAPFPLVVRDVGLPKTAPIR